MSPHVVAFVFARGGSKGLPDKNLRPLGGKPLVAWAIETARASDHIDRVVLSTEDKRIAEVGRDHGAEVPFLRPAELAGDEAPEWLAWRHAIDALESVPGARPIDAFVSLSPTAPLRAVEDVDRCIETFLAQDCDIVITATPARRNPYFNMVVQAGPYVRLAIPSETPIGRRQDAPPVYDLDTSVWVYSRAALMEQHARIPDRTKLYVIPEERSIDLDTELDFEILESMLERRALTQAARPGGERSS